MNPIASPCRCLHATDPRLRDNCGCVRRGQGRPRLGTAAFLAFVVIPLILEMGPFVFVPAQGPLADLRPLVVSDDGATAGPVFSTLDARHEAADLVQQLVIAT